MIVFVLGTGEGEGCFCFFGFFLGKGWTSWSDVKFFLCQNVNKEEEVWERERSSAAVMAKAIDPIRVVVVGLGLVQVNAIVNNDDELSLVLVGLFLSFVRSFVQKLRFLFSVVVESQIKILTYFASQRVFVWSLVHF